ncbi:MAG: MOSC domain-containing protein [Candidatus Melainabacteria bacterium]|nr:MAG: MOSC domain-containing protein [Candidatus Melainabacteria bacterium]
MSPAKITALYTYPIKSCAPISRSRSACSTSGLVDDREYVIVCAKSNKILTQRDLPHMARLKPELSEREHLIIRGLDGTEALIPRQVDGEILTLNLWGNTYEGIDQGKEIAEWLSHQLGLSCRLLKKLTDHEQASRHRPDNTRFDASFVDCCPLSVVFAEEVQELNTRLAIPVEMSRFRPSIVIEGVSAAEHQNLKLIRTENSVLTYIRPIARCIVINVDQERGIIAGTDCLKELAAYRMVNQKAVLGHYFFAAEPGNISVGETLTVCAK